MQYQLQEMLRVERVVREEAIAEEMAVWNELIPGASELSLTLMIEVIDLSKAKDRLHELRDLESAVLLAIGDRSVRARFDPRFRDDNRISAVQYIKFGFTAEDREAFLREADVRVRIQHAAYQHEARLSAETLAALRGDLTSGDVEWPPLPR
jgi:hypothetical protein